MRLHVSCQNLQWIELIGITISILTSHHPSHKKHLGVCIQPGLYFWLPGLKFRMFSLWPICRNRSQWEHTSVLGLGDPGFWAAKKATGTSCQPRPTVGLLTVAATLQATRRRQTQPQLESWSTNHTIHPTFWQLQPQFHTTIHFRIFAFFGSEYVAIYFSAVGYWRLPRGCKFCRWGDTRGWT